MFNKTSKSLNLILFGVIIFTVFPFTSYAQYYYNYYPYQNNYYYSQPTVRTNSASNITSSSATLNGSVIGYNISNGYNYSMWFEYGTSSTFGNTTPRYYFNSGYPDYSANIASLGANTVYYFRAVAQGPQGMVYGNTTSFVTSFPYATNINYTNNNFLNSNITTNSATGVSSKSAKLNSFIINSPNIPFSVWFEWGTTSALGNMTPITALGTLPSANHVSTITELELSTTYYFRAVAQNPYSRIYGNILSFTTNSVANQNVGVATEKTEKNTDEIITVKAVDQNNTTVEESVKSIFGANLIDSGSFFPTNAFGWLILIVFILVLLLLVKYLYYDFSNKKT